MSAYHRFRVPSPSLESGRLRLPAHVADADDRDVVRLRTDWPALLAMSGYAERATWLFGHRGAVLECRESRRRGCRLRATLFDATVRLELFRWRTVLARRAGATQYLEFYDRDGRGAAVLRLDAFAREVDELIWLLADDESLVTPSDVEGLPSVAQAGSGASTSLGVTGGASTSLGVTGVLGIDRFEALALAGRAVAQRLPASALERLLVEAHRAGIRARVLVERAGVNAVWSPVLEAVTVLRDFVEVRSAFGRLHVARMLRTWLTHLTGNDAGGPAIEARSDDGGRVRIDVADVWGQRARWRELCSGLVGAV